MYYSLHNYLWTWAFLAYPSRPVPHRRYLYACILASWVVRAASSCRSPTICGSLSINSTHTFKTFDISTVAPLVLCTVLDLGNPTHDTPGATFSQSEYRNMKVSVRSSPEDPKAMTCYNPDQWSLTGQTKYGIEFTARTEVAASVAPHIEGCSWIRNVHSTSLSR
jgi:hypothetical protein